MRKVDFALFVLVVLLSILSACSSGSPNLSGSNSASGSSNASGSPDLSAIPAPVQESAMRTVAEIASGREARNVKATLLGKGKDPYNKSVEQVICIKLSFDVVGTGNYKGQLLHAVRSKVAKRVGNSWQLTEIVNQSTWDEYSCPGSYERVNP